MKLCPKFVFVLLGCVLCATPVCANETKQEWMEYVTPAGEPAIRIQLGPPGPKGLFQQATLLHRLRFDGVRYSSSLVITELSSRLIPKREFEYEWVSPDGQIRIVRESTRAKKQEWRVIRDVGLGELAVIGENEVYVYKDSFLVECEINGKRYTLEDKDGVFCVYDQKGVLLIKREIEGLECSIVIRDEKAILRYDEFGRLLSCRNDMSGQMLFTYDTCGLLTSFYKGEKGVVAYEWGEPKNVRYANPPMPVAPVVARGGAFTFKYTINRNTLSGEVSIDGIIMDSWHNTYGRLVRRR